MSLCDLMLFYVKSKIIQSCDDMSIFAFDCCPPFMLSVVDMLNKIGGRFCQELY